MSETRVQTVLLAVACGLLGFCAVKVTAVGTGAMVTAASAESSGGDAELVKAIDRAVNARVVTNVDALRESLRREFGFIAEEIRTAADGVREQVQSDTVYLTKRISGGE